MGLVFYFSMMCGVCCAAMSNVTYRMYLCYVVFLNWNVTTERKCYVRAARGLFSDE